jgi:type IV pilus assembly protein PilV
MYRSTSLYRAAGFTMIEILVTLVVTAVGLAGFAVRASALSADSIQRARAAVLVNDMAGRLSSSKSIAATFVTAVDGIGQPFGATTASCVGRTAAARELCEWNNLLAGANDGGGGARALGYRGCVTEAAPNLYTVTVAWGSLTSGAPPADGCAIGVFGNENQGLRRVLRMQVRVATLTAT